MRDRIARGGPLGFPEFMETALYAPGLGYYAKGTRQVGRGGDFFTSVSVGPLFGQLLATRFLQEWRDRGEPGRWRIIECGAHDGTLAADVLGAMEKMSPRAFEGLEYAIPEPLPVLQAAQRETLRRFAGSVRFAKHTDELADEVLPGVAFGNELLDALAFHVVERRDGRWMECVVEPGSEGEFVWGLAEIRDPLLQGALDQIHGDFPNGYRSEVRTCFDGFLQTLVRALDGGLMIWPDYGFARSDYYHPARTAGTIRTFSNHRAGENPLAHPGEADITAHVDFTAVAETAARLGGRAIRFQNQGAWLTEIARDWLLSQEGNPDPGALRQFQTLTHPAHLGRSFHVLELSWRDAPACPDLARCLFGE